MAQFMIKLLEIIESYSVPWC